MSSNDRSEPRRSSARFWAVDLHVHTPASRDVNRSQYGEASPADIVRTAIDRGLDAIAITDHNTVAWCDSVAEAAHGSPLVVLPGVEISTAEGHLLAIWEIGTPAQILEECLTKLGIGADERGELDINAQGGFAEVAAVVTQCGGVAIAAHADAAKGLTKLPVASHVRTTLLTEVLSAVEIVKLESRAEVQRKVGDQRELAFVRGSDMIAPGQSGHRLEAIGERRTWIKASSPDLLGLRHAFEDPSLRISLEDPSLRTPFPRIQRVRITDGFLAGLDIDLSPDLNCLVGGTGSGKSLILECIRFAVGQQVDKVAFPQIASEVSDRLTAALGVNGVVIVSLVGAQGNEYELERALGDGLPTRTVVRQRFDDGELVSVEVDPAEIFPISAFSQGEALEYSRHSVGRMALVDAACDLEAVELRIGEVESQLRINGEHWLEQRSLVGRLEVDCSGAMALASQIEDLERLFDSQVVRDQKAWQSDDRRIKRLIGVVPQPGLLKVEVGSANHEPSVPSNTDLMEEAASLVADVRETLAEAILNVDAALKTAGEAGQAILERWSGRFKAYSDDLNQTLAEAQSGQSLLALKRSLETLQEKHAAAKEAERELGAEARPRLAELEAERERLLTALMAHRSTRRQLRRNRVRVLNERTRGVVKLDIPRDGDRSEYRACLERLKVGSRLRDAAVDSIVAAVHPAELAEALLSDSLDPLVDESAGVEFDALSRLYVNVADRDLWAEVLELQMVDTPDVLNVKFKREDGAYAPVESLAHGQRCTAMLITLVADGDSPVLVDQPEDALHAPWIEEHLVDRLRSLRGSRQYFFATRSPGLVVSADAEQIITLRATADGGEVEAIGSLERHDLNRLVLHHLEGGAVAFDRRGRKLATSVANRPVNRPNSTNLVDLREPLDKTGDPAVASSTER